MLRAGSHRLVGKRTELSIEELEGGYKRHLGFHSSTFYSPFVTFTEIFNRWEKAKANPEDMKVFVNGWLAEPYEENYTALEQTAVLMLERAESWDTLPLNVCCLTAACDVQKDRLEVLVMGWGVGRESYVVDRRIIYGDTSQNIVWKDLELFIREARYRHFLGEELFISCTVVDAGYRADEVYKFCHDKGILGVYAVKGGSRRDLPAVSLPRKTGLLKTPLFILGTHGIKSTVYYNLSWQEQEGAGVMHFKEGICDLTFFEQLTAERLVSKTERGQRVEYWEKIRERNEALDLVVYNFAALYILNPPLEVMSERLGLGKHSF